MKNSIGPLVLGIDLEGINLDLQGKGVNTDTDRVIEIGAALWDWPQKRPIILMSELIDEPDRPDINQEVYELTGIDNQLLNDWAHKEESIGHVLDRLADLMNKAEWIMAHNGDNYDIPMLQALFKRFDRQMPQKIWIDSSRDIEFPSKIRGRSMAMLEHSHGFVNPFPHRALTDTLSMLKIASQYGLTRMAKLAQSPIVHLVANLKAPNWKNKTEVEQFNVIKNKVARSGFRWDPSQKIWYRPTQKVLLDEGKIQFDFDFIIKEPND